MPLTSGNKKATRWTTSMLVDRKGRSGTYSALAQPCCLSRVQHASWPCRVWARTSTGSRRLLRRLSTGNRPFWGADRGRKILLICSNLWLPCLLRFRFCLFRETTLFELISSYAFLLHCTANWDRFFGFPSSFCCAFFFGAFPLDCFSFVLIRFQVSSFPILIFPHLYFTSRRIILDG
jgi:hypothetical protein